MKLRRTYGTIKQTYRCDTYIIFWASVKVWSFPHVDVVGIEKAILKTFKKDKRNGPKGFDGRTESFKFRGQLRHELVSWVENVLKVRI